MADPLTALMYAVQVMNFLKTLVIKTLREREESMVESNPMSNLNSFDDDGHQSPSRLNFKDGSDSGNDTSEEEEKVFASEEPSIQSPSHLAEDGSEIVSGSKNLPTESIVSGGNRLLIDSCPCNVISQVCFLTNELQDSSLSGLTKADEVNTCKSKSLTLSKSNTVKCSQKVIELPVVGHTEKNRGLAIIGRINSRTELAEAWR